MNSARQLFQYILLAVFGALGVLGVIMLATWQQDAPTNLFTGELTIWGPPFGNNGGIDQMLRQLATDDETGTFKEIKYIEKNEYSMYADLVEAIATGRAPNLIVMEASNLIPLRNKLLPLTYEQLPLPKFRQLWVEGSEVFALSDGIYALPLVVDPLILYWNRDLFTNAAVAEVPDTWETFIRLVPKLTIIKNGADLVQSGVAFGEYRNVFHATDVLSALMLQTGVRIVYESNGHFFTDLIGVGVSNAQPEAAVRFFTDFSNPVKTVYSWNKTFDRSIESFAWNKVAMYAGFASEIPVIKSINPNVNFDISVWPQSAKEGSTKSTYGKFYGIAVIKSAGNRSRAVSIAQQLAMSLAIGKRWQAFTGMPSVLRGNLIAEPSDPHSETIVRSTILARTWPKPGIGGDVDDLFATLIDDVVSGKATTGNALQTAALDLAALLENYSDTNARN